MRRRDEGRHLWAEEHEPAPGAAARGRPRGEPTPKQQAVLSMQGKVGNAAVSRSVQRFSWGDPTDWYAMLGGGSGKSASGASSKGDPAESYAIPGEGSAKTTGFGPSAKGGGAGQVTKVDVRGYDDTNQKQVVGEAKPTGWGSKHGPAVSGGKDAGDLWAEKSDKSEQSAGGKTDGSSTKEEYWPDKSEQSAGGKTDGSSGKDAGAYEDLWAEKSDPSDAPSKTSTGAEKQDEWGDW